MLSTSVASAATQAILGDSFVVSDPLPGVNPSKRTVLVSGKGASGAALVGDPLANGATLEIIANGAIPKHQRILVLPPGPYGKPLYAGWKVKLAAKATTYRYLDKFGANGPVRSLTIRRAMSSKTIEFKAHLSGKIGPIDVAPPNPGTDGGAIFSINGGDAYCVAFGGPAGGDLFLDNDNAFFEIRHPTRAACPANPNIIVIETDDQRWDTLQYMPITLDRIADHGVAFTNSFVATSLCTPSRVSFLTGQYAHHTGVTTNLFVPPRIDPSTIPVWLKDAGYRTGFYGKYYPRLTADIPTGWDDWQKWEGPDSTSYTLNSNGTSVSYGPAEADYLTDVLAQKSVDFINESDARPFFIYLAMHAPHSEGLFPPDPAPRHVGSYSNLSPWRPPSYLEADVSDKPTWIQALPINLNEAARSDFYRIKQIEALQAVDEAVGKIVDAIEAKGQSGNTAIVFTSDNGAMWGEHRLFYKGVPYEESSRVPLLIRYPRLVGGSRSARELVTNVDLAPTIAAIAGIAPEGPVDGVNIVPVLTGQSSAWRADVLAEGWFPDDPVIGFVSVRTGIWKYTEYGNGETELYNLVSDPNELENVAADAGNVSTVTALQTRLQELKQ